LDPSVRTVGLYKEQFGLYTVNEVSSSVRKPISVAQSVLLCHCARPGAGEIFSFRTVS